MFCAFYVVSDGIFCRNVTVGRQVLIGLHFNCQMKIIEANEVLNLRMLVSFLCLTLAGCAFPINSTLSLTSITMLRFVVLVGIVNSRVCSVRGRYRA